MAKLAKSLNTDLPSLAKLLERKGRGKDTVLAHITPKEAEILHKAGGRGSKNPDTGLLEFEGGFEWFSPSTWGEGISNAFTSAADTVGGWFGGGEAPVAASPVAESGIGSTIGSFLPSYSQSGAYTPAGTSPAFQSEISGLPSSFASQTGAAFTPQALGLQSVTPEAFGATELAAPTKAPAAGAAPGAQSLLSGITKGDLLKLGLAGGLGLYGMSQAKGAAKQGQQQVAQMQQIAQPYQTQGQAMAGAAQRGELTPQSQQAYQAMQAQLKQGVESRGGVGSMQAAQALEQFRNQLLTNQYQYGLQVANIGDQIALGAIKTGMQLDQNLSTATQNFYTGLANVVGSTWRTA